MRVDFYRFEDAQGPQVAKQLAAVLKLPDDDHRTIDLGGVPFRMHSLSRGARYWEGDMVRIRMDDFPLILSLSGEESDIDVDDDEGMGKQTAFLYDTKTQVLSIQSNRTGVSASKFAAYLEAVVNAGMALVPVGILDDSPNGIIRSLKGVRKVSIRVAGIKNAKLVVDPQGSTRSGIEAAAATAPVVELTLGMGHARGSLPLDTTKGLLKKLISGLDGGASVDKVRVIGTLDGDTQRELDLLQFLIKETVEVAVDRKSRRAEYADRLAGVKEAWGRRRDELEGKFA